jgi:hypothetical protein
VAAEPAPRARRPLWIVVLVLVAAAAALWASSRISWDARADCAPRGDIASAYCSSAPRGDQDAQGAAIPLAILALAGVAGAVAAGGWLRRALGVVLLLAGGFAFWQGSFAGIGKDAADGPAHLWGGRGLAMLAGMLIIAAGVLLIWFGARMPRLGAAYQTPGGTRRTSDPDKDMWVALSEGDDPTTDDR